MGGRERAKGLSHTGIGSALGKGKSWQLMLTKAWQIMWSDSMAVSVAFPRTRQATEQEPQPMPAEPGKPQTRRLLQKSMRGQPVLLPDQFSVSFPTGNMAQIA